MGKIFGMANRRKEQSASQQSESLVSLPPVESISVRLCAVSLVTRSTRSVPVQLAPSVQHDRKSNLIDIDGNIVTVSVRDTVRALPVFEVIAEWQLQLTFTDAVDKTAIVSTTNWQWVVQHVNPYTFELTAHLTMRSGFAPVVLPVGGW